MSSSSPSIVSFDSIVSDLQPLTVPELYGTAVTRTNSVSSWTGEPSATDPSTHLGLDHPFLRYDTRFFEGGNVTFLPAQLGTSDHEALAAQRRPTRRLRGLPLRILSQVVKACLPCRDFEGRNLSHQQWALILHLSMRWGSASILKLALKSINPPTPHDQFMLAHPMWSTNGPTVAHQMGIWDVVLVAVREDTRSYILPIDGAEVTRIVEAALVGKLPRNDDDSASPEGGAAKNKISNLGEMTQLEGKGIAKSPEENGMQGVGNAARLAQASLKRDGERNPKPIGEY
ncbi:hypothetical protein BJY52DRAFT_1228850 [Lactarius psammicola]|nr:hypothetical protein BJY52DRAFT_1228850 [Lactarius psammicola]